MLLLPEWLSFVIPHRSKEKYNHSDCQLSECGNNSSKVLFGREAWSVTLREERRVFKNRILRRIFGPKRDGNGKWRRLHNEELNSFYRSPNIVRAIKSRRLRWAGHVARMEDGRNLPGKPTGKRPLERPRRRW